MKKPKLTNYSERGIEAASNEFYHKQGDLLAAQFRKLNTESGVVKPAKPASLTKQFGVLTVNSTHPPERKPHHILVSKRPASSGNGTVFDEMSHEVTVPASSGNGTGFDEMSHEVTVPASSGNGADFYRMVFDRSAFGGTGVNGTGGDSFVFYGLGRDGTDVGGINDDGMETAPAPAPAPDPAEVRDQFERLIIKPSPHGGKKRKSKRMKTRYRKKYKGKRSNKTRRYRK